MKPYMTQINLKVYTFSKLLHLAGSDKLKERVRSYTGEVHFVLDEYIFTISTLL